MLDWEDGSRVLDLIDEAVSERDRYTGDFVRRARRYDGSGYDAEAQLAADTEWPVNHAFEWLSLQLSKLVYHNPKVSVSSSVGGVPAQVVRAHEHALTRWMDESLFSRVMRKVAHDYAFLWGVVHMATGNSTSAIRLANPERGEKGPLALGSWRPTLRRVDPRMFIMDNHATSPDDARYMGHLWVADREALIAHAKAENQKAKEGGTEDPWNIRVLESLPEEAGAGSLPEEMRRRTSRGEIVGYDLWIREHYPDDSLGHAQGYHGSVMTIVRGAGDSQHGPIIRKPQPAYVPKWGPYTVFGAFERMLSPWPLAPLAAAVKQETFLNQMVAAANRAAKDYRRIIVGPHMDDVNYAAIPDGMYVPVPGWPADANPIMIELGGTTDQMLRQIQLAHEQLERLTGMDQAKRGSVTGRGTATEHAIADASVESRMAYMRDRFQESAQRVLSTAAWYHHNDARIEYALSTDAAKDFGSDTVSVAAFVGGKGEDADDPEIPYEALQLEIVPMSMERTSEPTLQRNILTAFEIVTQSAPMIRAFPEVPWARWLDAIGDALNIPDLGEDYDWEMAAQMAGTPPTQPPQPQTTLAPDRPATVPRDAARDAMSRGAVSGGSRRA